MLHRNAAQRALEKELALLQKQEGRMEARALAEKEGAWKAKLEEKVPEKVYTSLEQAFCKAFALVFEKGTGIIEKSYDRDALEKDYAVLMMKYILRYQPHGNGCVLKIYFK